MTLEELTKSLGLDTEENKEKAGILKKEYNSLVKSQKTLSETIEKQEKQLSELNPIKEKFDIIVKSYQLNIEAEDFDKMLDDRKTEMVKEAGGGTPPEEVTRLNRELTKSQRDLAASTKQVAELQEKLNIETTHRINGVKKEALHKALTQNNVIKPEQFIDMFINKVDVDKDGITVTMKDETGTELGISDAIADWAKANPEFVKKDVLGGFGSGVEGTAGGSHNSGLSEIMQSIIAESQNSHPSNNKSLIELFG